jgi:hypothetical protein
MGSSASVPTKISRPERCNRSQSRARLTPANFDADHLSESDDGRQNTRMIPHNSTLVRLHAFAARIKCEKEDFYPKGFFSLHKARIEEYLEAVELSPSGIDRYWASVPTEAGVTTCGVPTLELPINQVQVYEGLYPYVTPLMQAVLHSNLEAVELLISLKADVNAVTQQDVPYYRNDLPFLRKGTSVLMMALYKLFDLYESAALAKAATAAATAASDEVGPRTEHPGKGKSSPACPLALTEDYFHTKRIKSLLICSILLDLGHIDVTKGFVNSAGGCVTAVTIAGVLIRSLQGSLISTLHGRKTSLHLLRRICDRVIARAAPLDSSKSGYGNNEKRSESRKLSSKTAKTILPTPSSDSVDIQFTSVVIGKERR